MSKITQYSAVNLVSEVNVDAARWNALPPDETITRTVKAIQDRGIQVLPAQDSGGALEILKRIIPPGAEVMNGSSTTLIEIGFMDYLSSNQKGWNLVHTSITAENDDRKRAEIRRRSVAAEYFISGANAIATTGEIVACDASGSRVGAWPFAAGHLILVAGINKIVPTVEDALNRIRHFAYPLEDARARKVYGTPSIIGKCVILSHEKVPGRIQLVLVRESLGY